MNGSELLWQGQKNLHALTENNIVNNRGHESKMLNQI